MKRPGWTAIFAVCLTVFTVFISLDTFLIPSVYQTDATEMNLEMLQAQKDGTQEAAESTHSAEKTTEEATEEGVHSAKENPRSTEETTEESTRSAERGPQSAEETTEESTRSAEGGSQSAEETTEEGTHSAKEKPQSTEGSGHSAPGGKHKKGGKAPGEKSSFNEEEAIASAAEVTAENVDDTSARTYQDDNIKITYSEYTTNGTTVHVADVQLSSVEYLKTAFAQDTYGKNVTESTSATAESHGAILAVNGDYYGVQETGYVIRNGIVYRDEAGTADVLCIYADGSMAVIDPSTATAEELVEQGVWQAFSFGPGLLENNEISVSLDTEVGRAKASNPRTAIGMIDPLHYVFVVSDGRTDESEGLSLYELASFMQQLGVKTAYNLDGGGSSTMFFQGEVVNDPTGGFGDREREVSDIVYIG